MRPFWGCAIAGGNIVTLGQVTQSIILNGIASLNFTWIRVDIYWSWIQITPTIFDFSLCDMFITNATNNGLSCLFILNDQGHIPAWETNKVHSPGYVADFTNFCGTMARRYPNLAFEILNEPNVGLKYSPKQYSDLLIAAYAVMKKGASQCVVLTGGLAPAVTSVGNYSFVDYVNGIFMNGAGMSFDGLALHPYSYPVPPSYGAPWNAWQQVDSLKNILKAQNRPDIPIWFTEFGSPTNGPGSISTTELYNLSNSPDHVDESLQRLCVEDAIQSVKCDRQIAGLFFYSYQDLGRSTSTIQNFFGLLRLNGISKPSVSTLTSLIDEF